MTRHSLGMLSISNLRMAWVITQSTHCHHPHQPLFIEGSVLGEGFRLKWEMREVLVCLMTTVPLLACEWAPTVPNHPSPSSRLSLLLTSFSHIHSSFALLYFPLLIPPPLCHLHWLSQWSLNTLCRDWTNCQGLGLRNSSLRCMPHQYKPWWP
jgi:hypothetical protein